MAYDKQKLYKQAVDAITNNKLIFVEEVVAYLPCDKKTFYRLFPVECNECNKLKELININKVTTKQKLRQKWEDGDNATLQLALYKLLSTDKEMLKLAMQNIDVKTGGDKITGINIKIIKSDGD